MTEKVKVSQKVANILNTLRKHNVSNKDILDKHKAVMNMGGWVSPSNKPLNELDVETLEKALKFGYESEGMIFEVSEPMDLVEPIRSERPPKKTPHQMGGLKIFAEAQKSSREELEADLDYELDSLHDAMERQDEREIDRCKKRLAEIHKEMDLETV